MEPPRSTFAILAGEGIGPFRLGMTRERVREIAQRELGIDVDACNAGAAAGRDHDDIGDTGLVVDYDANGCGKRVWARWGFAHLNDSAFTLFGKDIRAMDDTAVIALCKDHWPDVASVYTGMDVPSAGLSATYWDNFTDGCFCSVEVMPRATGNRHAGEPAPVFVQTPLTRAFGPPGSEAAPMSGVEQPEGEAGTRDPKQD